MQDQDIEKLFATAKTEFDDSDRFETKLAASLAKVEFIKQMEDRKKRSYKKAILTAFISGAVCACAGILVFYFTPDDFVILQSLAKLGFAGGITKRVAAIIVAVILGEAAVGLTLEKYLRDDS